MGFNAYMYTCMTIFMHFVLFFIGITSMRSKKVKEVTTTFAI